MMGKTAPSGCCRLLEWDTSFFGFGIGRFESQHLSDEDVERIRTWCRQEHVDCLYFEARSDDAATIRCAERNGFQLTDVRVQMEVNPLLPQTAATPAGYHSRSATVDDIAALRAIARDAFTDTRFFFDERFPRSRCGDLYEAWVEKSFRSGPEEVLRVTTADTGTIGFTACRGEGDDLWRIGLLAVSACSQGRGGGIAVLQDALRWFSLHNGKRVVTVTQARNVRAQRLYQRAGFRTCSVGYFYHFWCQ